MKKHPNKKRVMRKLSNTLVWHYFGTDLNRKKLSPMWLRQYSRFAISKC